MIDDLCCLARRSWGFKGGDVRMFCVVPYIDGEQSGQPPIRGAYVVLDFLIRQVIIISSFNKNC